MYCSGVAHLPSVGKVSIVTACDQSCTAPLYEKGEEGKGITLKRHAETTRTIIYDEGRNGVNNTNTTAVATVDQRWVCFPRERGSTASWRRRRL